MGKKPNLVGDAEQTCDVATQSRAIERRLGTAQNVTNARNASTKTSGVEPLRHRAVRARRDARASTARRSARAAACRHTPEIVRISQLEFRNRS